MSRKLSSTKYSFLDEAYRKDKGYFISKGMLPEAEKASDRLELLKLEKELAEFKKKMEDQIREERMWYVHHASRVKIR